MMPIGFYLLMRLVEGFVLNLIGYALMRGPAVAFVLLLIAPPLIAALPTTWFGAEQYCAAYCVFQAAWAGIVAYTVRGPR